MKRYISFNYNVYSGNLKNDFYKFALLRKPVIIKYKIKNFIQKLTRKKVNKWEFLESVNVEKTSLLFWKKNKKKINYDLINDKTIIVGNFPEEVIKFLKIKIKKSENNFIDYVLEKAKANDEVFYHKYNKKLKKYNLRIKVGKKYFKYGKSFYKRLCLEYLKVILLVLFLSFGLSIVSLYFAKGTYELNVFLYYFNWPKLIFLNTFPIIVFFGFLYLILNRFTLSFFLTSIITIILTMVNYFKIMFRNEPFTFADFTLISEANEMLNTYMLNFPIIFFVLIILFIILLYILNKKVKNTIDFPILRIILIIIIILGAIFSYKKVYTSGGIYDVTPVVACPTLNTNSATQKYISKGFIYPFIYSSTSKGIQKPIGYDEKEAKKVLYKYKEEDIENKTHIISIMLESYSDFTGLGNLEFNDKDVYGFWHDLEEKSYNGNIISSVFGGGTINTERKFLTGLSYFSIEPIKAIDSYVRYFYEQGYVTIGSHPGYSWFYNRININKHFGFEDYKFFNDTNKITYEGEDNWGGLASDHFIVKDIIKDYENTVEENKYLFNFSVTYQNHGPQRSDYRGDSYIERLDSYSDDVYSYLNYYFDGIYKTNLALKNLIEYFEKEEEPVVIILFGDHKPDLSWDRSGYTKSNINIDITTDEGFMNYYETPYVIWGNDAAKKTLGNELVGEGPDLSSNYLMGEFFELAGYKGPSFMQYSNNLKKDINVLHHEGYEEKGIFTRELSSQNKTKLKEYEKVEYYYYSSYKK